MEFIPILEIGWLNGWTLVLLLYLNYEAYLLTISKNVRTKLFFYDRSHWSSKQRIFYIIGKASILFYFGLITFLPLQFGNSIFIIGIILYVIGLTGFIYALSNF